MPTYTIAEFAGLVGKKPKDIHVYIGRKKVIKDKNNFIDSTVKENKEFMELRQLQSTTPKKTNGTKTNGKKVNGAKKINGNSTKVEQPLPVETISPLNKATLEQKQLSNKKSKRELEIKDLEFKRLKGDLIDLNQTITLVSTYSDSLKRELDQSLQTEIQDFCARNGIDSGTAGKFKLKMAELINKSSKTSIELLLKQF